RTPVDIVPPPASAVPLLIPSSEPAPATIVTQETNPFAFDPSGTHSTLVDKQATVQEPVVIPLPIEQLPEEQSSERTARGQRESQHAEGNSKFKTPVLFLAA